MFNPTEKRDWLNDLLAANEDIIVSGHPNTTAFLNLDQWASIALRFVGNRRSIYLLLITVLCPSDRWRDLVPRLREGKPYALYEQLRIRLGHQTDVLVYDPSQSNNFLVSTDCQSFFLRSSKALVQHFRQVNPALTDNPGVYKRINRTVNDSFQQWTRSNLSRYLVINDFDALLLGERATTVLELKRVQEDLMTWRPYLDDSANYATIQAICNRSDTTFRVIAYQSNNAEHVALHEVTMAAREKIQGKWALCRPSDIFTSTPESSYASSRRRESRY